MEVKSISSSQTAFNGYIGKNLTRYINTAMQHESDKLVRRANESGEKVDANSLKEIYNIGSNIKNNLNRFLHNTDKNTALDIEYNYLIFKNSIAQRSKISIYGNSNNPKGIYEGIGHYVSLPFNYSFSRINDSDHVDLEYLNSISEELLEINPNEIDKVFLKLGNDSLKINAINSTGFFERLHMKKLAKKIDKFAKSLGIENSAANDVLEYLKQAKEKKQLEINNKKLQKQLEKENKKIAKKILNS